MNLRPSELEPSRPSVVRFPIFRDSSSGR
jgi:hypothetical protein